MKKVLCFGDSNTYGFIPGSGKRYDKNTRWTGVLQNLLGEDYKIIEAGCNGRTAFVDNDSIETTGYKVFSSYLSQDLDFVVVSIGLNDLQIFYQISELEIKSGIEKYVSTIKKFAPNAGIILAAPSHIKRNILNRFFSTMFDETAILRSCVFSSIYQTCAIDNDCIFIDLNEVAETSDIDGLHYSSDSHLKIAQSMCELLKK